MGMLIVGAPLALGDGDDGVGRRAPQLFRPLQFIPGREFPVGFDQKEPGGGNVFRRFDDLIPPANPAGAVPG